MMKFFLIGGLFDLLMFMIIVFPSYYYGYHPLVYSILLLLYSVIMSLKMNYLNSCYWYSYLFFLLMVGGVMILILYLTSISNNEIFIFSLKSFVLFGVKVILLTVVSIFLIKGNLMLSCESSVEESEKDLILLIFSYFKELFVSYKMSIYMLLYLFFLMLVSTLVCSKSKSPMRQMIKYENLL